MSYIIFLVFLNGAGRKKELVNCSLFINNIENIIIHTIIKLFIILL